MVSHTKRTYPAFSNTHSHAAKAFVMDEMNALLNALGDFIKTAKTQVQQQTASALVIGYGMKYLLALVFQIPILAFSQGRTLGYFIEQAQRTNPALQDYQAQLLAIRLDSQILNAALRKPQVAFLSSNSYAPIINGYGYDEPISNIANVSAVVQATRNFSSRGHLAAQFRAIALQNRALLDTIRLSQRDLVRTITDQYLTAYSSLLQVDFNHELYALLKKEEVVLKKLTEASVYRQTDYLTFYTTMQQQELAYLQAQIQYNSDYLALNYLAGIFDTAIQRIDSPQLTDAAPADLYQSPFYTRFVTDSLRIANERALIQYQYKPRIGVYTDAGYNSSLQYLPYKNFGFSAGISLSIPIYDGRQRTLQYAKLSVQERRRQVSKDYFFNQYRQQIAQLQQNLKATGLLTQKIEQQLTYTRTLIAANNKLLETGDITIRDYVLSINTFLAAQNALTQNNINRLRTLNQLAYWNR